MPNYCAPTPQDGGGLRRSDSDSDICIDDENFGASSTNGNGAAGGLNGGGGGSGSGGSAGMGPRRNSINRVSIRFVADDRSLFASYKNRD